MLLACVCLLVTNHTARASIVKAVVISLANCNDVRLTSSLGKQAQRHLTEASTKLVTILESVCVFGVYYCVCSAASCESNVA
jgi:hypothetical protein